MRALIFALSLTVAGGVAADDGAPTDYLDTVLVSGSRTPTTLGRVGASATIIDRDQFAARQSAFAVDLLRGVPGVTFSNAGGFGKQTQLRMRGAEANHVKVMIDGIEANDLGGNDEFEFGNLTSADIERIEIVRGPQSSLWGSDALAGVVNIITRKDDGPLAGEVDFEGGSYGTHQEHVSVGTHQGAHRWRLGVSRISTAGSNISRLGNEDDAYRAVTANLSGAWRPSEILELSLTARTTAANNQVDAVPIALPIDSPGVAKTDQTYIGTHAKLALAGGHWLQQLDATWSSTDNDNVDPTTGPPSEVGGDRYKLSYQNTALFALAGLLPSQHSATLAVDYEYASYVQRGTASFFGDPNLHRHMNMAGLVGEYRVSLPRAIALSGSVRHDFDSEFRDVTTYRGALTWQFAPTASAFNLAYGTGQKAPTFTERFGFASSILFPFFGNSALKPAQSHGWEIGLSQPLFAGRLRVNATYFSERLDNEILGFVRQGAFFTAVNLPGTSLRDGIEIALSATLPVGFTASTSYTYLDATARDHVSGHLEDEVRRPHHQVSGNLTWNAPGGRWHTNVYLNYSGQQRDFDFQSFPATRVDLKNFTVLGASATYDVARWLEVYARVDNALDERYEEILGYQAPGIAGYAGLRLRYDRM